MNDVKVENQEEEEGDIFANLFICEDYVIKKFDFGGCKQSLLCSNMSTTDHDLTGQIVWPASKNLGWFVAKNGTEIFEGKTIIELGAGCGLAGFVASQFGSFTTITDGNEIVLKIINRNLKEVVERSSERVVKAAELIWGEKQKILDFLQETGSPIPDVVIGADVILWPAYTQALLQTVRWLLALKPRTSMCYISYLNRAQSTTDLLFRTASELSLKLEDLDMDDFLPSCEEVAHYISTARELDVESKNEAYCERSSVMHMFSIRLDLDALSQQYPQVDFDKKTFVGSLEVSDLFTILPSEEEIWKDDSNTSNRPF